MAKYRVVKSGRGKVIKLMADESKTESPQKERNSRGKISNELDNSERLGRILAAVADSGAELSDSEVVAEAKEAGINPKQTLAKVQGMLTLSLQRAKKALQ